MTDNAIEMLNITKKFGNFKANDDITFKVKKNSIHAIIGENGAGKSTLMNQLFGLLSSTSGLIKVNNKTVNITNPNDANELGLSMVHQHFQLVDNHTVLENILLGDEGSKSFEPINFKKAKNKLINISKKYNLEIDPDEIVKKTSVGMQQRIEILKMLYRGADILIFDEPTAMLIPSEIEGLLKLFLDFKKQGKTIIFISHKLDEIKYVADIATIIRKGKVIKSVDVKKTDTTKMAELMVGRKLAHISNDKNKKAGETIISIKGISVKHSTNPRVIGLRDFNLDINAGEIVAIAGVEGNGQLELVNAIYGLSKISKGSIEFNCFNKNNKEYQLINLSNKKIRDREKLGIAFVPEDRYKYAMLSKKDIFTNTILRSYYKEPYSKYGLLQSKPRIKMTRDIIKEFDVRGANLGSAIIGELSGGNQQKFIVGREMNSNHKLLILFQPTRGLDLGAIEFLHKKIILEKEKGNAVLLVSYDLNEVMKIADRVAVLNHGDLISVSNMQGLTKEKIGKWMAGVK